MRTHHYPSDVTDEQWPLIEPLIPVYPGGRPRKTDLRDVVDAVFYILRTGMPVALPARRLPAQEHRLALLRRVAPPKFVRIDRSSPFQGTRTTISISTKMSGE